MQYTIEERRAMHSVLVRMREFLWDGTGEDTYRQRRFLCHCASAVAAVVPRVGLVSQGVVYLLEERLQGHGTLSDWLSAIHGVSFHEWPDGTAKLQATRKAWLESLIEEFSDEPEVDEDLAEVMAVKAWEWDEDLYWDYTGGEEFLCELGYEDRFVFWLLVLHSEAS